MGVPSVMKNLPPLGKATAAFDEDVGGVEAGDGQYAEREAHTLSPVTMLQCYIFIFTQNIR